ncbi:MAG TPA: NADH-quinone oxidoreductase subunit C [Acidimicrobiia bacterium]|nr:NADH-quinone oxidoreductase subunit C [Acidimicrobiia bacterium]
MPDETTETTADDARENVNEAPAPSDEVAAAAVERFESLVAFDSLGQAVLYSDRETWLDLARWLRDEQQFEACIDLCGVDHLLNAARLVPDGVTPERFEVVANFRSIARNRRIRAICEVPQDDAVVPSMTEVYPGADWPERETYDLFGIVFDGHPDLTRILLPEDWEGYPLRKDAATARVPVKFKGPATTPFQQARDAAVGLPKRRDAR